MGYEQLHHLVVTRINGVELLGLKDVEKAIGRVENGLHKVEFSTEPIVIFLDSEQVASSEESLAKAYRLPLLKRLE